MRLSHLALALMLAAGPLAAQEAPTRQITVTGVAEADAVPDLATVTAGVETRRRDRRRGARRELRGDDGGLRRARGCRDRAARHADEPAQHQPGLRAVPRRAPTEPQKVVAYEASNMVTVRVRAIDSLGAVIDAVTKAGSNRLFGISFDVAEPKPRARHARASRRWRTPGPRPSSSPAPPASPSGR